MKKVLGLILILTLGAAMAGPGIKQIKVDDNFLIITDTTTSFIELRYAKSNIITYGVTGNYVTFYGANEKIISDAYHLDSLVDSGNSTFANIDSLESWIRTNTGFNPAGTAATPTLDEVTTEGATTANAITTGAIDAPSIANSSGALAMVDDVDITGSLDVDDVNINSGNVLNFNGNLFLGSLAQTILAGGAGGSAVLYVDGFNVLPWGNNQHDFGSSSLYWKDAFITGTISTTGTRVTQAYFTDLTSSNALIDGGTLSLDEVSASNADVAGRGQFWVKDTTNTPKFTNDAGTDYDLVTDTYTGDVGITGSLDVDNVNVNGNAIVVTEGPSSVLTGFNTLSTTSSLTLNGDGGVLINDNGTTFLQTSSSLGLISAKPLYRLESTTANADVAGYGQFWVKNNTPNSLYFTDDAGNDWQLTDTLAATGLRYTNAYFTNHTTTNAETVDSDRTLKDNITPIKSGLSIVNSIEPVSYNWKPRGNVDTESTHYGVIAQQVQPIVPDIVTELDNGKLSVRYSELIPFLIKAVQEQQAKIEELETRIQNLE